MKQNLVTVTALFTVIVGLFGITAAYAQAATDNPDHVEAGMAVYAGNCAGCHGADGEGSDRGRPLTGIAAQEPDRLVHIASVTDGKGNMPAFGDRLTGEEIDAAISHVRLSFAAEPAADAAPAALPATGSSTYLLAIGGVTLLLAGFLFAHHGRRFFAAS